MHSRPWSSFLRDKLVRVRLALVTLLLFAVASIASTPHLSHAQGTLLIKDGGATLNFPDSITFKAHIEAPGKLERVVLEYGVEKQTCGTVIAKALPNFNPDATSTDVSWTWDMRKSGSEPPGSRIWYRWRATDKAGASALSDKKTVLWLDTTHKWDSLSKGKITFHWYSGSRQFAQGLLDSASDSLTRLSQTTGVTLDAPVDMYIYANNDDMQEAVLYEPNWTGGQAFPDSSIVIIGIGPDQTEWGKKTEAHELTHVLVGHLTFSCLGSVPTWLNEGIAVYGEGGPDDSSKARLQTAIAQDALISVRALSGGFSEHPDKADLSYAQSYSLVDYLVTRFGRDKMLKLFGNLRDGMKIEDALRDAYSIGLDGLEDGWRASVGAKPRSAAGTEPPPTDAPTPVPTYRPSSDAPLVPPVNTTPQAHATSKAGSKPTPSATILTSAPAPTEGSSLPILMAFGAFGGLLIAIALLFALTRNRRTPA